MHPKLHVAKAMEITAGESLLGLHMQNKLSCTPGVHEACMLSTQVDFKLNNVTVSPFLTPLGSILSMLCVLYLQDSESAHLQHQRCQTRTALNVYCMKLSMQILLEQLCQICIYHATSSGFPYRCAS